MSKKLITATLLLMSLIVSENGFTQKSPTPLELTLSEIGGLMTGSYDYHTTASPSAIKDTAQQYKQSIVCTDSSSDSTYTNALWRSRLIYRDAAIKRFQDTLIIRLENKIHLLERNAADRESQFQEILKNNDEQKEALRNQINYQTSISALYKHSYEKQKMYKEIAVIAVILETSYLIFRPFKPP